jgi:hypothetical protein
MNNMDSDTATRLAALAHIRHLLELRDALTASDLKPGFQFGGSRIPLINPQRGIFKPTQMKYLLSIKTVEGLVRRSAGSARADFRGCGHYWLDCDHAGGLIEIEAHSPLVRPSGTVLRARGDAIFAFDMSYTDFLRRGERCYVIRSAQFRVRGLGRHLLQRNIPND